jgi:hypothetical protein
MRASSSFTARSCSESMVPIETYVCRAGRHFMRKRPPCHASLVLPYFVRYLEGHGGEQVGSVASSIVFQPSAWPDSCRRQVGFARDRAALETPFRREGRKVVPLSHGQFPDDKIRIHWASFSTLDLYYVGPSKAWITRPRNVKAHRFLSVLTRTASEFLQAAYRKCKVTTGYAYT